MFLFDMCSEEFRRAVEENLDRTPLQIALDRRVSNAAAIASQVKYLRRAEGKLPSYHAARCILPPLAFEQSSSEATAERKNYSGELCIDLTCGLGVDAFHFSKKFKRVTAVERDPELAAIARENFRLLGACNIEVVCASAEEFLAGFGGMADLIYVDPDRRSAGGRKKVRIEDCSPDVAALLPLGRRSATRLVVKLSPLFDVDEAFRIFDRNTRVETVSLGGECKETVADFALGAETAANPTVCAVAMGIGEVEYPFGDGWTPRTAVFEPERYRYLVIPDVALQKARIVRRYFSECSGNAYGEVYVDSDNGYGFAAELPPAASPPLMGKVLEIQTIEPFDPKALRRHLKSEGIRSIDILKRDFPLHTEDIARRLGIREGGKTKIAFTGAAGKLWQITMKN